MELSSNDTTRLSDTSAAGQCLYISKVNFLFRVNPKTKQDHTVSQFVSKNTRTSKSPAVSILSRASRRGEREGGGRRG